MKNKFYLAVFFMLLGLSYSYGQDKAVVKSASIENYIDTIPFQYQNDMIVVTIEINGKARNFFFDTGAPTLISKELQQELNLTLDESKAVTDASLKTTEMQATKLSSLKIGNLKLNNVPVTVFDMHSTIPQLACMHIEGLLGVDVFKQFVLQIDLQNKRLILSGKAEQLKLNPQFLNKMTLLKGQNSPLVEVKFGNVFVENALFDTGMNGGLYSIADHTYAYVKESTNLNKYIVAKGYGATSKVASGTEVETEKVKLKFDELSIGAVTIKNPVTSKGNHPYSLLGVQVLKYGKATFDFKNQQFCFEPIVFDNTAPIVKTSGFELKMDKNTFFVGVVWKNSAAEKKGLKAGFRIIEYGSRNVEHLTSEEVCKVLLGDSKDDSAVEKKELKLKFMDDKGKIRSVVLPMVDITSLKS